MLGDRWKIEGVGAGVGLGPSTLIEVLRKYDVPGWENYLETTTAKSSKTKDQIKSKGEFTDGGEYRQEGGMKRADPELYEFSTRWVTLSCQVTFYRSLVLQQSSLL